MKDSRLRRHPLVALRDRLRGGPAAAGAAAKRNSATAATAVATLATSASTATSALAKAPDAPLYYLPPIRAIAAHRRPGPQLLSDQLYETVHPLLFSSASPSISGIASSGGDGESLMLGSGAFRGGPTARADAGGAAVSSVANSSISTRPDSGESAGQRRPNCDCDFCQRVATADFSPDVTATAAAAAPAADVAAPAAGSDLDRSETIDWYNVSAEIEAATAAAASAAPASAAAASAVLVAPSRDQGASAALIGDSTREIFGEEVRLTLQSSAAGPSTAATAAAASSTPHQPHSTQPQSRAAPGARLPGESAMPPYSRQLLARLLAEPSPSTTNTEGGRDSNFLSPASSSPSVGSFAVNSPLLHNSRCSPLASSGLTEGAPVNPDLAGLDFSSAASSFQLVGSAATPTSTSSLLSETPPPPPPPPPSAPSMRRPCLRPRLPPWSLRRVGPAQSPSSASSYKSSLVPSSTESSLSGYRPGSLVLTPPPGFGSPVADVTVVAVVSSVDDDTAGSSSLRLRRVRRTAPQLRRANAFSSRLRWH